MSQLGGIWIFQATMVLGLVGSLWLWRVSR